MSIPNCQPNATVVRLSGNGASRYNQKVPRANQTEAEEIALRAAARALFLRRLRVETRFRWNSATPEVGLTTELARGVLASELAQEVIAAVADELALTAGPAASAAGAEIPGEMNRLIVERAALLDRKFARRLTRKQSNRLAEIDALLDAAETRQDEDLLELAPSADRVSRLEDALVRLESMLAAIPKPQP